MALSRRQVFRLGLAVAALPRRVFGAGVPGPAASLSKTNFEAFIGTTFTANQGLVTPTWLTLAMVQDLSTPSLPVQTGRATFTMPPATEAFALKFNAVGAPLSSDSHEFQHPTLGLVSMFVTGSGNQYTAAFNHLLSPLPANYPIPSRPVKTVAKNRLPKRPESPAAQTAVVTG